LVKDSKDTGLSGLVNAVLQKIVREKPILPSPIENVPAWLRTRWERHYDVAALAAVAAERPPLDMVAAEPQTFAQGERIDAHVWRLPPSHESVTELEGFGEGAFWVQDVAATYPVRALGDVKGLSILDIGAAPGGKTAQLAKAGAQVTALDKSAARMDVLKENMARLKLTVEPVVVDALRWEPGKQFDAVLLDAPCSATGTWRRHPEVLHITTQHDITELSRTQREMLTRAWQWVKPGGRLVYCTCSLEPEEGEQQAQWFVANHSDAAIAPVSAVPHGITTEGYVRTTPALLAQQGGMDGFFAAIFKKQ
jgi:16S rRNA (cytosine967-C5)-methyltransferase